MIQFARLLEAIDAVTIACHGTPGTSINYFRRTASGQHGALADYVEYWTD